jgi:hypothetical protein
MKIYLAGQCPYPASKAHAIEVQPRFLHSYLYMKKFAVAQLRQNWDKQDIMVDSGGFSVRTGAAQISVTEYAIWLKRVERLYTVCINLDTRDMDESLRNQRTLERAGLRPLPVYHYSDFMDRRHRGTLQHFIDEYPYISVGGMAKKNLTKDDYKKFLDYVFSRTGKTTKVHGLGLTSTFWMSWYPFYSVDSSTWLVPGLFGDFVTMVNGQYKRVNKKRGKSPTHHGLYLTGPEKISRAADAFAALERTLTERWARKGYQWT